MKTPLQITFRAMDPSPSIEQNIRERVDKLEEVCGQINSCHVAVEAPHRHHHQGGLFRVRVDITVPGKEIVVGRNPAEHHAHEDAHVAVRDAFRASRRALESYNGHRRRRGPGAEPEFEATPPAPTEQPAEQPAEQPGGQP